MAPSRHSKVIIYSPAHFWDSLFTFLLIKNCKQSTERRGDPSLNTYPQYTGNRFQKGGPLQAGMGCKFPNKIFQSLILVVQKKAEWPSAT